MRGWSFRIEWRGVEDRLMLSLVSMVCGSLLGATMLLIYLNQIGAP